MNNKYNTSTRYLTALPRSERRRDAARGIARSVVLNMASGGEISTGTTASDTHTHNNKETLDRIAIDDNYYLKAADEEGNDVKVSAGYADYAGELSMTSPTRNEFLSSQYPDTAQGRITFEQGIECGDFIESASGMRVDNRGNGEFESVESRSWLKVHELIYNRLSAVEGDTILADVGTIDRMVGNTAVMRRRWEGDFTAFQVNDIVFGYVNSLGSAEKTFIRAWARVAAVDSAANCLHLDYYSNEDTPAGKNHPFTEGMVIARWGNTVNTKRQSTFIISTEQGNIIQLIGVSHPIISRANYGTVLGRIPEGLLSAETMEKLNPAHSYLYARGIVVEDLIREGYVAPEAQDGASFTWNLITGSQQSIGGFWVRPGDLITYSPYTVHFERGKTYTFSGKTNAIFSGDHGGSFENELPNCVIFADNVEPSTGYEVQLLTSDAMTDDGTRGNTFTWDHPTGDYILRVNFYADGDWWVKDLKLEDGTNPHTCWTPSLYEIFGKDGRDGDPGIPGKDGEKGDKGDPGSNGEDGRNGLMVYPAGEYSPSVLYSSTGESSPCVLHNGSYYVLRPGYQYHGWSEPTYMNPAMDYARGINGGARWMLMEQFNSIFANILMADFAKLSSAVFYGDWMISQNGKLKITTRHMYCRSAHQPYFSSTDPNPAGFSETYPGPSTQSMTTWMIEGKFYPDGNLMDNWSQATSVIEQIPDTTSFIDSDQYQYFKDNAFEPYFSVNFKTGKLCGSYGVFSGSLRTQMKTPEQATDDGDAEFFKEGTLMGVDYGKHYIKRVVNLICEDHSIILPTDPTFIGSRLTICNATLSSLHKTATTIRTENGSYISGLSVTTPVELNENTLTPLSDDTPLAKAVGSTGAESWTISTDDTPGIFTDPDAGSNFNGTVGNSDPDTTTPYGVKSLLITNGLVELMCLPYRSKTVISPRWFIVTLNASQIMYTK